MQLEALLKALADPTRLRIMRLLAHMELAVGELAQVLEQSQPRVSRHVRILCAAGLAERRKEGSWVFLRAAISETSALPLAIATARLLAVSESDDGAFAAQCREDRQHLAAIRAARQASAEAYFARHAGEWDTLRSLHSPDEAVEEALKAMLDGQSLGALLDVGTGTGRMAELFAPHAAQVTALDKSPEMLRVARSRLDKLPSGAVNLVQGDFTALPFSAGIFDTVLFHQVLHYAQNPTVVLAEAARATRPGGHIAIVDFAAHDREELRERHAHARLGFTDEQMMGFLADAGFASKDVRAVAGQPLTVKIWTARKDGKQEATAQTPRQREENEWQA
ncbi:metalloregulator ArsR/SmtB family transcription factor [Novosphingobium sp. RD2P27]|uniref:Metalloregulator ArsR/SmtB family transcription factor n=1 Tax=Novosphingobium kalidii TaxID=3230299 RepID=A0ABV2CXB6_9SPHN